LHGKCPYEQDEKQDSARRPRATHVPSLRKHWNVAAPEDAGAARSDVFH
jgi:hypothetical protein